MMTLIQNFFHAEGPIHIDWGFKSHLSRPGLNKWCLGHQCYEPNLVVSALEEPRTAVCKKMVRHSVVLLIPIAINSNRICNASVVWMGDLANVFFFWHFLFFILFLLVEIHL